MSLSKIIPQITNNVNSARGAELVHDGNNYSYTNDGIIQNRCKEIVGKFMDAAVLKLATEKRLTLPLFGTFSLGDDPAPIVGKLRLLFFPTPTLLRKIEETPVGTTTNLLKETTEWLGLTQKCVREITDEMQRVICASLASTGEFSIQSLGKFRITSEASSEMANAKVQFLPKKFLRELLSKLSDKQIAKMVADRKKKQANRKMAVVSSGSLDRKRLARVRKLLHARDPENVAMAMLVLEQIALPDDYVAVFETSGLMERLLRADSADVVDAAAKIVAATNSESVRDRFWKMIGLKDNGGKLLKLGIGRWDSVKETDWISTTTLREFFRDTRNQCVKSVSIHECCNLSDLRLAGLRQLSEVSISSSGITSLRLEHLPALKTVSSHACGQLCELALSGLENLRELDLSSCSIQSLPEEIGELCSLQAFNLGGNPLTALPDSIGQLTQLESLDLGGTNLTEFPDNIVGLAALTELDLSSTRLESLPATIGQLKSLRSLILPVGIKEVPRELAHLRNLKKMMIGDHYSSDDSSTTRIILNLCRQLVAESRSGRSR